MSDEFTTITEQPCACGARCDKKFRKKKLQIILIFFIALILIAYDVLQS